LRKVGAKAQNVTYACNPTGTPSRQIDGYALAARAVHRAITTSARLLLPRPEQAIRGLAQ
jgi:hypothetical protein